MGSSLSDIMSIQESNEVKQSLITDYFINNRKKRKIVRFDCPQSPPGKVLTTTRPCTILSNLMDYMSSDFNERQKEWALKKKLEGQKRVQKLEVVKKWFSFYCPNGVSRCDQPNIAGRS